MDAALIYKWNATVPGREAAGLQLMKEVNEFCEKAIADGQISSYDWYLPAGPGWSLLVVHGEWASLQALVAAPEMQMLNMRSALVNEGLEWGFFGRGDAIEPIMGVYGAAVEQVT